MKAELQEPGMYFVVANPKSFELLPEYRDSTIAEVDPTHVRLQFEQNRIDEVSASAPLGSSILDSGDPNTIILGAFEEPVRRGSMQLSNSSTILPNPLSSHVYPLLFPAKDNLRGLVVSNTSNIDEARAGGRDSEVLQHYRTAISHHITEMIGDEDIFETQAWTYPPVSNLNVPERYCAHIEQLFHAMMALAAHSLAHKNGLSNTDALEYYQQVIPALKTMVQSSQDSYSDGPLLTHTFLLMYEVRSAFRTSS